MRAYYTRTNGTYKESDGCYYDVLVYIHNRYYHLILRMGPLCYNYPYNTISALETSFNLTSKHAEISDKLLDDALHGILDDKLINYFEYIFEVLQNKYDAILTLEAPMLKYDHRLTDDNLYYTQDYDLCKIFTSKELVYFNFDVDSGDFSIRFGDDVIQINSEVEEILYKKAVEVAMGLLDKKKYYNYIAAYLYEIEGMIIDIIKQQPSDTKSAKLSLAV